MNELKRLLLKNKDFVGVSLFIILFNSFTVLRRFAWGDDWAFISGYKKGDSGIKIEHYSGYRPVLQKIMDFVFGNISNYQNLVFLRLISTLGMVVLTWQVMKNIERMGYTRFLNLTLGLGLNLLPTFWIYTNWAATFIYPWACVLSILSLSLFKSNKLVSVLLLVLTFMIYQPAAVFSVFIVFAGFLRKGKFSNSDSYYLRTIILSAAIALASSKFINQVLSVPPKARTEFLTSPNEIVNKLIWLATRPFLLSFRPFLVESHGIVTLVLTAAGFLFSMVGIFYMSKNRNRFKFLAGMGVFYLFGLLPIIPIAENQIEFRILPATSAIGLLLLLVGVQSVVGKIQLPTILAGTLIVSSILGTVLYSENRIQNIFIKPFERNQHFLLSVAQHRNIDRVVIVSDYENAWPQRNYVGALSVISDFQMPWVPVGEVAQLLGIDDSRIDLVTKSSSQYPNNYLVIKLDEFRSTL